MGIILTACSIVSLIASLFVVLAPKPAVKQFRSIQEMKEDNQ